MSFNKFIKSKRLKYGTVTVVFTAAFIAVIIAFNLILSAIGSNGSLTFDLTKEDFYTIGDETKAILGSLGEEFNVTVYFLASRDQYDSSQNKAMIRELGEEFATQYPDNVKVEFKDINKDPAFLKKIQEETQVNVNSDYVVIKGKYHYRVLSLDSFFSVNEDNEIVAFNGELRYTTAFLQCSINEPQLITFTIGHGETISQTFASMLLDAGFEIQTKDLSKEEIDPRTKILIISNPTADFIGYNPDNASAVTEIEKISTYVGKFNSLIVFVDSNTPALPNLQDEFLALNWGINYKPNHKIQDTTHSVGTISNDGYSVVGSYVKGSTSEENNNSLAYNIHKVASSSGSELKSVFRDSVELYKTEKVPSDITISSIIQTYDTAQSIYMEGNEQKTVKGVYPLMMVASRMDYGENNVKKFQYLMLVGSTKFASDTFLSNEYGNRKVVLGTARVFGPERVAPDIKPKYFTEQALKIELGTASALTWIVCAIFPIAIVVAGAVVFFKRRHL